MATAKGNRERQQREHGYNGDLTDHTDTQKR